MAPGVQRALARRVVRRRERLRRLRHARRRRASTRRRGAHAQLDDALLLRLRAADGPDGPGPRGLGLGGPRLRRRDVRARRLAVDGVARVLRRVALRRRLRARLRLRRLRGLGPGERVLRRGHLPGLLPGSGRAPERVALRRRGRDVLRDRALRRGRPRRRGDEGAGARGHGRVARERRRRAPARLRRVLRAQVLRRGRPAPRRRLAPARGRPGPGLRRRARPRRRRAPLQGQHAVARPRGRIRAAPRHAHLPARRRDGGAARGAPRERVDGGRRRRRGARRAAAPREPVRDPRLLCRTGGAGAARRARDDRRRRRRDGLLRGLRAVGRSRVGRRGGVGRRAAERGAGKG